MGDIAFVMKAKTLLLNVLRKQSLFSDDKCCIQLKIETIWKKIEELDSIQNQIKDLRLQDKLNQLTFHEEKKKLYEPFTNTIKTTSQDITKTITETSIEKNQGNSDLREKVSLLLNDKGMIAPYLASSSINLFKRINKSQYIVMKDPNSIRMNIFLINTSIPVTLYSNILYISC